MGLLTKNKVYLFFAVLKINKIVSNLLKRLLKKEKKRAAMVMIIPHVLL